MMKKKYVLNVAKITVEKENKNVYYNPEHILVIEEKVIGNQLITIYHYLTFKLVIVIEDNKIKSANVIDRELCVCGDR